MRHLLTSEERRAFVQMFNPVTRSEFVTAFWRARDPRPETMENEFREEFEKRVAFADSHFTEDEVRGSLTDRGMVFVLLIGEVDLSVGSLVGLSSAIIGVLIVRSELPWWLAVFLALAITSGIGALQGSWSAYFGVPTFVVTLAGLLGWLGVQLHVLGTLGTVNVMTPEILNLTTTNLPKPLGWLLVACIVIFQGFVALRRRRKRETMGLPVGPRSALIVRLGFVTVVSVAAVGILNQWKGVPTAALILLGLIASLSSGLLARSCTDGTPGRSFGFGPS